MLYAFIAEDRVGTLDQRLAARPADDGGFYFLSGGTD